MKDPSNVISVPDGGWGWVITAATFIINIVMSGVGFTFGAFLPSLVDTFQENRFTLSWIPSIQSGVGLFMGPVTSLMGNKWGFRSVGIMGCVIACIGMVLSCFANHFIFLYITMGVIVGIGQGIASLSCLVMVSVYFDKRRALATGISVSGSGAGVFIFGQIVPILISAFSWRGACILLGGLFLQCCVFCALFRPLDTNGYVAVKPVEIDPPRQNPSPSKEATTEDIKLELTSSTSHLNPTPTMLSPPEGDSPNKALKVTTKANNNNSVTYMGSGYLSSVIDLNDVMSSPLGADENADDTRVVNMYISSLNSIANIPINESKPSRSCLSLFCNVGIFRNVAVSVFMLTNFLLSFCYAPAFTFVVERSMLMGYSEEKSKHFLSFMGILNCVSRLVFGFVASFPVVNKNWLFSLSVAGMALSTLLSPLCKSTWSFMTYCCFYGLFTGNITMLQTVVLCDLVKSPNELGSSLGMLLLVLGTSSLFCNPLSGAIFDATKNYDTVFLVNGGILALAFIVSIGLPVIVSYREGKQKL